MGSPWRTGLNESISQLGPGLDFTSVNLWEATVQGNHTAAGDNTTHVLEVQAHASDQAWLIVGSINDATHPMIVRGHVAHLHHGIPGPGFAGFANTSPARAVDLVDDYVWIQGLVVTQTINTSENFPSVLINTASEQSEVVDVLVYNAVNIGTGQAHGLDIRAITCTVINTLIHNCDGHGVVAEPGSYTLYNVTATNNAGFGILNVVGSTMVAKNCLSTGNVAGQFQGNFAAGSTENVSSDATAPGTNPVINASVGYVDALNDDFHLTEADRTAIGTGADLSADPTFPFDQDIDRATILTWHPGFDSVNLTSSRRQTSLLDGWFRNQ